MFESRCQVTKDFVHSGECDELIPRVKREVCFKSSYRWQQLQSRRDLR